jgi:hypothetical protein
VDTGNQIFIFLICVLTGVIGGVFYEVFSFLDGVAGLFCRGGKSAKGIEIAGDILFFLCFSVLCVFVAVLFGFPDFRVYMVLGNLFGLILYLKSLHRIVAFFKKVCYNSVKKIGKKRKNARKEVYSV